MRRSAPPTTAPAPDADPAAAQSAAPSATSPAPGAPQLGPFSDAIGGTLGLRLGRVATALACEIREALGGAPACVIVVGDDLARALYRAGLPVVAVSPRPRRRRRRSPPQIAARLDALPLADGCADAVVIAGLPEDALAALSALARLVRDRGVLAVATAGAALVRKTAAPEQLSAALVHAALVEIEQRRAGSALLGFGRVRKWGAAAAAP